MKKIFLLALLIVFLLCSCSDVGRYTQHTFFAMNTVVTVIADEKIAVDKAEKVITDLENVLSRTKADSEVSKLNAGQDAVLSQGTLEVIQKAMKIAKDTDYAFSPCLGALTELWNITSGGENIVPSEEQVKAALALCDTEKVYIDEKNILLPEGTKIDLGGVAKGYALQRAVECLKDTAEDEGISADFCISLGGNVGVSGSSESRKRTGEKGWNVGITNPFDKNTTLGTVTLEEGFVSVSGAYERFFEKDGKIYHHIFDSKTGYPAESDLESAVVVSLDGLEADALSTAFFVMGKEKAVEFFKEGLYECEILLVTKQGELIISYGLENIFIPDKGLKDLKGNYFYKNITVID